MVEYIKSKIHVDCLVLIIYNKKYYHIGRKLGFDNYTQHIQCLRYIHVHLSFLLQETHNHPHLLFFFSLKYASNS